MATQEVAHAQVVAHFYGVFALVLHDFLSEGAGAFDGVGVVGFEFSHILRAFACWRVEQEKVGELPLRSLGEALSGLLLRSGAIDENLAVVAAAGQHARGHHGIHAEATHAEYLASFGRRDEVAVLVGYPSHFQASC